MKSYILIVCACASGLMVQNAAAQLMFPVDEVHGFAIVPGPLSSGGTVELLDPSGVISDELLFVAGSPQAQFFSDPLDEPGPVLADVLGFPTPIPPIVTLTEGPDGSAIYHPTAGMPGFVPGLDYELHIQSDADGLPVPSAAYAGPALLALLGLTRALRRRPLAG